MTEGTNCYAARNAIVVTAAGSCEVGGYNFTANSTGTYFIKHEFTSGLAWCEFVEFDTRRDNAVLYLTNRLGKKFAITVDDSGTLTATEVT